MINMIYILMILFIIVFFILIMKKRECETFSVNNVLEGLLW